MSLQSIASQFETFAIAELKSIAAKGIAIEQVIAAEIPTAFETLVGQVGPLVMTIITNLATAELAKLSGNEKANLAATTLVEKAALEGIEILAADATALVKTGFEAFKASFPLLAGFVASVETAVEGAIGDAAATVEKAIDPNPA